MAREIQFKPNITVDNVPYVEVEITDDTLTPTLRAIITDYRVNECDVVYVPGVYPALTDGVFTISSASRENLSFTRDEVIFPITPNDPTLLQTLREMFIKPDTSNATFVPSGTLDVNVVNTPLAVTGSFTLPPGIATEAKQDVQIANFGAQADAVAISDTGTFSFMSFFKRQLTRLTDMLARIINIEAFTNAIRDGVGTSIAPIATSDTDNTGLNPLFRYYLTRFSNFLTRIPTSLTGGGNFRVAVQEPLPAGVNNIGSVNIANEVEVTNDVGNPLNVSIVPPTLLQAFTPTLNEVPNNIIGSTTAKIVRVQVINTNNAERYVKLYFTNSAPTVGLTPPNYTFAVPRITQNGGVTVEEFDIPIEPTTQVWVAATNSVLISSSTFTGNVLNFDIQYYA